MQLTQRLVSLATALLATAIPATQDRIEQQTSGGELRADQACYDVERYELFVVVDPEQRSIQGKVRMHAVLTAATDRIALDLDDAFEVDDARWEFGDGELPPRGRDTESERTAGRILFRSPVELPAGTRFTTWVIYNGEPRIAPNPPWKGGFTWSKTRDGRPWIATSCQGEGADLWWPCKDHPADEPDSMRLTVVVPAGLVCASNGTLDKVLEGAEHTTWVWQIDNPIANYSVALNIAPYEVLEDTFTCCDGTELPVFFWVLPENVEPARKHLPEFLDHLRHLESVCGPYPWRNEKYGIVETPHLGMEHQTIIAYGNRYRRAGFDYDWLHHHELSHEWWANLVTNRDWKDMWVHEGIGTYMQALYIEERFGTAAYHVEMGQKRRMLANRSPIAPREVQSTQEIYFGSTGNDIYYKGSWVCHTLRWLLGDETFFTVLRRWAYPTPELEKVTDGSQARFTDTQELIGIAEQISGQQLAWFFEVYLRRGPLPRLNVAVADDTLTLHWQAPDDLPFTLPVPVRIGDESRRVAMPGGRAEIALDGAPWVVDPDDRLLMERRGPRSGE